MTVQTDINITVAGAAGQGLVTISSLLLKLFSANGYHLFASQDYMSRVRGGHNFMRIRVSNRKVLSTPEAAHILIALDQQSIDEHSKELISPALVIHDPATVKVEPSSKAYPVPIPLMKIAMDHGGAVYGNGVAFGAIAAIMGLEKAGFSGILKRKFLKKGEKVYEANVSAANAGFDFITEQVPEIRLRAVKAVKKQKMLINGAEAIGLGMIAGGLRFISAYPMSPSTGIFNYITGKAARIGIISEQAEDEISAINMALGASAGGARAAVTTSGGGLALMAEGISLAGVSEIPIVVSIIQRPGPATGLPTRTAQEDLDFVLSIGHGEFPRFVFAPNDAQEAFYTAAQAMNLADKYQVPVFVLGDQHLVDSYVTVGRLDLKRAMCRRFLIRPDKRNKPYLRYRFTKNGVSPRAYYGQIDECFMTDSHVHTEDGHITEDKGIAKKMVEKRFLKLDGMEKEFGTPRHYGSVRADFTLVSWGSTYGAVKETVDTLNADGKKAAMVHFNRLWPFPSREAVKLLGKKKRVHVVENNYQSQFARLLKRETGIVSHNSILRYDGRPFNVRFIVEKLREKYRWRK